MDGFCGARLFDRDTARSEMSMMNWSGRRVLFMVLALMIVTCASLVTWRFSVDMAEARARVGRGSILINTPCGPIEYAEAGAGPAFLAVHGSGGGFDQGMAFAAPEAARGVRIIALSRYGSYASAAYMAT